MKVLQINSVCGVGSTGRIVVGIHDSLVSRGHDSYIAFGRLSPRNYNNVIRIESQIGIYSHVVLTRLFDNHGFGSKRATQLFVERIKSLDLDIVHIHNIHGYYINVEVLFKYLKRQQKPVVWTLHDCWAFTGHCTFFDDVECDRWRNECHNCPQWRNYPSSVLFDNSKRNYQRKKTIFNSLDGMILVTPSKWLAGKVSESFLSKYPVKVIYNGIDLDVFKPVKSIFRERNNLVDKVILLGVANVWDSRKGLEDFIELSKHLTDDYRIILVGLTDKQMRNLPANIIGIKRTNDINELASIYSTADLFLNLSVEETMGLTTVEALACGTPAVVYNCTALPEVIDESSGIVVEKRNLRDIIHTIDSGFYTRFKKEDCIRRAMKFDQKRMFCDYIELYSSIVSPEVR